MEEEIKALLLAAFLSKREIALRLGVSLEEVERVEQELDVPPQEGVE